MNNDTKTLLLSENDIKAVFEDNLISAFNIIKKAFIARQKNDVLLPDKISQIFDEKTQSRINCMPAAILSDKVCGVKWVAVFPENASCGMKNVTGTIILSEIQNGRTLSVMDGTYLTRLRTAAMGALAAKYLAVPDSETIGFIGAGKEARTHLDMIKAAGFPIKTCYVASRRASTAESFISEESGKHPGISFINCGNDYEKSVKNADIIVTATSSQLQLLKASYIKDGAFYIHVGGIEDEYAVPKKASKIVCDEWSQVKHRSQTISCMFKEGLLKDSDIYADLAEICSGRKAARENSREFIYFCSVGLAYIDTAFANFVYNKCIEKKLGQYFEFS